MAAFRDQIRLGYNAAFLKQADATTLLADGDIDTTLTATLISPSREVRSQFYLDCSNQYLQRRVTVARLRRMTIELLGSPHLIGGFLAGCMGTAAAPTGTDPKTHAITMIGPSVRELPYFTFMVGLEDGTGEAWKWGTVVVDRVALAAAAGDDSRWRMTVDLVGSGARTEVTGWTWPACSDEEPAALYDGSLTINGTDYIDTTKAVSFECANGVLTGDSPFVGGSLDAVRFLRSPQRGYTLSAAIQGVDRPGDALNDALVANSDAGTVYEDTALVIGVAASNGVTINIPEGYHAAEDPGQGFYGEAEEAVLNLRVDPTKVAGDANSPVSASVVIPSAQQSTAYLVADS
jgi:hypothetical protein